jgi:hypothetical protein
MVLKNDITGLLHPLLRLMEDHSVIFFCKIHQQLALISMVSMLMPWVLPLSLNPEQ